MALTMDQITITEIQEQLNRMYTARARVRRAAGGLAAKEQIGTVEDDQRLSTINAAQHALDNVYAAYS